MICAPTPTAEKVSVSCAAIGDVANPDTGNDKVILVKEGAAFSETTLVIVVPG